MGRNIDQLLLKISGKSYIETKRSVDQDVRVVIEGAVVKEEVGSNQDGGVNVTYVVKATTAKVETL